MWLNTYHIARTGSQPRTLDLDSFILKIFDAGASVAGTDKLAVFTYDAGVSIDMTGFNLDPNFDTSALDSSWTIGTLELIDDTAGTVYLTGLSTGLLGDADGDGDVDAADYIALKTNMGQPSGAVLADGDFNEDGKVDWYDLQLLQDNYGAGSPGAAGTIPEPGSAILLMFGAAVRLGGLRRRRAIVDRIRR